eukprot:CAMPEP_0185691332 /NCGR_PEP_ID=MMETSP1164-20130828/1752_1 /TAXON_ID=1104430 /ORGANISM="Chrysoreinhardia sp, Strain CCMP2950" /LENGTH=375 /DNA_ID=CAMNT_0028357983 /DNA_START=31 /DNA_END=1158 /DNA_ORIENTATION=-
MVRSLVVASLMAVAAAAPRAEELSDEYSFEKYCEDFGLSFGEEEMEARRSIFDAQLSAILAHNAQPDAPYTQGVNQFTASTAAEIAAMKGLDKRQLYREKAAEKPTKLPKEVAKAMKAPLPASVDWRTFVTASGTSIVTDVKNQGGCGSCWAFAATEALESHVALATGTLMEFAPQEFVDCAPNPDECGGTGGCAGATAEIAYGTASQMGCWLETTYPYQEATEQCAAQQDQPSPVANVTGFVRLPRNEYAPLLAAVATIGPIAVSVDASWTGYESGVFPASEGGTSIDHAVVLMGYGTDDASGLDYWLIRNSWGETWGEAGYIRLERQGANATCAVDKNNQAGVGCADDPKQVTVCGTSAILYDSSYPTGAYLM